MKIKTQFIVLVAGIILIPLVLFSTLFLVIYYRLPERAFTPGIKDIVLDIDSRADTEEVRHIERYIQSLPPEVQCMLLDTSGKVLFSSMPEISVGTVFSDMELMEFIRDSNRQYLYQVDLNLGRRKGGGVSFMILSRVMRDNMRRVNIFLDAFFIVLSVFAAVFVFAAAFVIWIARSIAKSVTLLEEATRSLAAGDLDTEIVVTGSNEITSLSDSLNRMRGSLKDQMVRRSRFIMGLSHDLRTPIALIKGYSEAIKDGMADDPVMLEKSLNIIGTKIDQLENLINNLINSMRLETTEWKGTLTACALAPFLKTYAERTAADGNLLHKQVSIAVAIPGTVTLQVDEEIFTRLLDNITGNAFRYTGENGRISFSAVYHDVHDAKTQNTGQVVIEIADDGCGIEEKDLPYIFDSFFRGTNSRREEGYGFGLATVKHIADSYGWKITVQSKAGCGTSFTIVIPL